jgi:hypothetical protein
VADRREPSDGDDDDDNSAVPKKKRPNTPNMPNTERVAALHKAERGSLAADN